MTTYEARTNDMGSMAPYFAESRNPIPSWATNGMGKYARYGAATGYVGSGVWSLLKGLGMATVGGNILFGAGFGLLAGGIARLGYNLLKRYKILPEKF